MSEKPTSFTIKNWSQDDQPREKLRDKGKASLSDAELIAILIALASPMPLNSMSCFIESFPSSLRLKFTLAKIR